MCFSSIAKKQIVALTGLLLITYVIGHLAGNLMIYGGPELFNYYAAKLKSLGPLLKAIEVLLFCIFLVHIWFTVLVVLENIRAKGGLVRYAVDKPVGKRSLATRIMPYSGIYILLFVVWHIFDFTLIDHEGARSYIAGKSQGLYGVVVNSFADPLHGMLYILAVCFLGMHLTHGVQSVIQTFGFNSPRYTPKVQVFSRWFALAMVVGYCSIPVYVLFCLT